MKKKLNTRFDLCIVTVVKDNANALERTKESLLQIPKNVQWIVQSFSSESYREKVGANIVFNYSADTGIYNAMNEALKCVNATWVLFLNAGDCLDIQLEKLTRIIKKFDSEKTSLLFNWSFREKVCRPKLQKIKNGSAFCHQAVIISFDQFENQRYDEKYFLASDYKFFLSAYLLGCEFTEIETQLVRIEPGGVSDTRRVHVYSEFLDIQLEHGLGTMRSFLYFLKNLTLHYLKVPVKILVSKL
ncbi:hypothetical protein N9Y59_01660 [Planktomarina temperata]|nr:hypothetical protein [Planktomarina temperata]